MLARSVRSGLTESYHDGAVLVLDLRGDDLLVNGDVDRPFFLRSAIKPFQAQVVLEAGAGLNDEQLAVACSSHGGQPAHLAIAQSVLARAGLDSSALQCPPEWPLSASARNRMRSAGISAPTRIMHNCSGKHAAVLAACVEAGWPVDDYTRFDHPYHRLVTDLIAEVSGMKVTPTGVDGCGFPTFRGTVRSLARAFHALATDERFHRVRSVMSRMPALTADNTRAEAAIASWIPVAAKVGAMACAGVAAPGRGAAAGKSWDGTYPPLWVGLIEAMRLTGWVDRAGLEALAPHARPPVLGGGQVVGALEPALAD